MLLADIVARHAKREGPLLLILHDVQAAHGHVSEDAIREIAKTLNLTRAGVHGTVSFHLAFKTKPEAFNARGVEALVADVEAASTCSARSANLELITDLAETMKCASLRAIGGFTPYPVMSAINHWPEDFR